MFEMIQQTDFRILDWIQANLRTPWLDWFAPKVTFLCEAGWFWIALTLVFLLWKKHRRLGATMFVGLVLCVLFGNIILKHAVARPRPCWINQRYRHAGRDPGRLFLPVRPLHGQLCQQCDHAAV